MLVYLSFLVSFNYHLLFLRFQESMMDFYWHYSGKSVIDCAGVDSFIRAIHVAAQVFCSITEYIQVTLYTT